MSASPGPGGGQAAPLAIGIDPGIARSSGTGIAFVRGSRVEWVATVRGKITIRDTPTMQEIIEAATRLGDEVAGLVLDRLDGEIPAIVVVEGYDLHRGRTQRRGAEARRVDIALTYTATIVFWSLVRRGLAPSWSWPDHLLREQMVTVAARRIDGWDVLANEHERSAAIHAWAAAVEIGLAA